MLGESFSIGPCGVPDGALAVGPFDIVAVTNCGVKVFRKNGTPVSSMPLAGFFSSSDQTFDPRAAYDEYIDRFWIVAASANNSPQRSNILVALSNSSDATDGFSSFALPASSPGSDTEGDWCDYPTFGLDMSIIYIACNMIEFPFGRGPAGGDFDTNQVRIMTKNQFLTGCCQWFDRTGLVDTFRDSFTIQPAYMHGASTSTPELMVNAHGRGGADNELSVWEVHNAGECCDGEDGVYPEIIGENYTVGDFDRAPLVRDAGTNLINPGGTRLQFAFWQDGLLSTGQTVACESAPGDVRACVAFTELDLTGGVERIATVNDWVHGSPGTDFFTPSVEVNEAGDKTMVYARSSPSEFVSARFVDIPSSRRCTYCVGTEGVLQAGQAAYSVSPLPSPFPWGDYSSAAPDPDGTGIWILGHYVDAAGRHATAVGLTYEAADLTPPATTASLSPLPSDFGWNNSSVVATLRSSDAGGSGVRRITYQATGADPIPQTISEVLPIFISIGAEGYTTLLYSAEDNWGNVETPNSTTIRIDRTDPVVTCGASDGLWHADNVSIDCRAFDGLSGLADPADLSFSLHTSVPDEFEEAHAFTNSRTVCDQALNCVTAGPIGPNMVDRKAPRITRFSPGSGPYLLNEPVAADYSCLDLGSGTVSCVGTVPDGANIDTASVGTRTFLIEAADAVGNRSFRSVDYKVAFAICLRYDPSHAFRGTTVPIRLALCDYTGNNVSANNITLTAIDIDPPMPLRSRTNPDNLFRFDPSLEGGGGYVFNLDVRGFPAGTYALRFKAEEDPTVHSALFIVG